MNILHYYYALSDRLVRKFHYAIFLLFKKPLYLISYNSNGNRFICKGLMSKCSIKVNGEGHQIIIEEGVRLHNMKIVISGQNNRLILHKGVKFYEGGRIKLEDEGNLIEIGENSDFVDTFFAVSDYNTRVIIGRDCMFSAKIIVRSSDVHSILNEEGQRTNPGRDTIIGNRVWVAYGATILKGCFINDDSVVGTHSVVARLKTPNGSVVVGNPAKVVRQGIHWDKIRIK